MIFDNTWLEITNYANNINENLFPQMSKKEYQKHCFLIGNRKRKLVPFRGENTVCYSIGVKIQYSWFRACLPNFPLQTCYRIYYYVFILIF